MLAVVFAVRIHFVWFGFLPTFADHGFVSCPSVEITVRLLSGRMVVELGVTIAGHVAGQRTRPSPQAQSWDQCWDLARSASNGSMI